MSGCGCVYLDYDGCCEFSDSQTRKARKTHQCDECGREILRGEQYEHAVGKLDGDFFQNKTCADCLTIGDEFFCGSWAWGNLLEDLLYHFDSGADLEVCCLDNLTATARRRVVKLFDATLGGGDDD